MTLYRLKVSIIGIPKLYRLLDVPANSSFEALHEAIFDAFDRYDPHLYSFFITRKDTKSLRTIYDAPEITHPQNTEDLIGFGARKPSAADTCLGDLDLQEKEVFHYLFDFGDDWWHRIRVESVLESPVSRKTIKCIKSVGPSPDQYPDYNDDDDDVI